MEPGVEENREEETGSPKMKEIYTYEAPWDTYALDWSLRRNCPFRLAASSFNQEYSNKVEIIQLNEVLAFTTRRATLALRLPKG